MSVQNATILATPTVAVTGGTSHTFTASSQKVNNGINIVDTASTDFRTRHNVSLSATNEVYDAAGKCIQKAQRKASSTRPKLLADGTIDFNNATLILKINPESTDAEQTALMDDIVQIAKSADFANFRKFGSLA